MTLPIGATVALAKLSRILSRWLGRGGGTAIPGKLADQLDPDLIGKLAAGLPHGAIVVTGTNGKTTSTKLLAAALAASGEKVLTNRAGSNLKQGILSALIDASNRRGQIKDFTIGLFEVDEATLRLVAPALQPRLIMVLNLFRDQLDRYGELDTTASLIGQGIEATSARLVLNADDPLVASLARYGRDQSLVTYFGIEGLPASEVTSDRTAADSDRCPVCNHRLQFGRVFYAHIGHYRCPNGHFNRPQPEVVMTALRQAGQDDSQFEVSVAGKRYEAKVALPGVYNLYNALAALAGATTLGVEPARAVEALGQSGAAFGRVERVRLGGRRLQLVLVKNPTGFTQVLETVRPALSPQSPLLILINDNYADGRDVSWLWDVPFELLAAPAPTIITSGSRAADMALRLKYAEVSGVQLVEDPASALDALLAAAPEGGMAYILPTYTAMLAIRKVIARRTDVEEVWK